jgi:cytidylate kinase
MIITIARECGSDGYTVGQVLSKYYGIPLYDKHAIIETAKKSGIYSRMPNFFAENPVNSLLYAIAEGEGISDFGATPLKALQEIIGEQSCIIIGRCSNYVFKERTDAYRVFLYGSKECRVSRIMEYRNLPRKQAEELVEKTDNNRACFQKYYTGETWGMASNYDISLDSSKLGIEGTAHVIMEYIKSQKQHTNL